jgi:hypothetical protein
MYVCSLLQSADDVQGVDAMTTSCVCCANKVKFQTYAKKSRTAYDRFTYVILL